MLSIVNLYLIKRTMVIRYQRRDAAIMMSVERHASSSLRGPTALICQVHAWLPFGSGDPGLPLSDARSLPGFSDILLVTSHGKQRLIRGSESKGWTEVLAKRVDLTLPVPTKTLLLCTLGDDARGTSHLLTRHTFLRSLFCIYLQC